MKNDSNLFTIDSLAELAANQQSACLSLYQPTHRSRPESQQDPIRFRNLIKELAGSLQHKYPAVDAKHLLEPFEALAHDSDFWSQGREGLAVLGAEGLCRVFRLQQPVTELAVVSDRFHLRPLRRTLQSLGHYQVLGLSMQKIRLFEGNRNALDEVDLAPGVPHTIDDALGKELTEPVSNVTSHGSSGHGSISMHHGHGGKKDQMDSDAERFFRAVDRAVLEHHSRPSGLPLILAALPEHHDLFHRVSHNPFLIADGLTINPDALSLEELRERAWQVVEPQNRARMTELSEGFAQAQAKGFGNDDLAMVTQAAAAGRVATLLLEADRQHAGLSDGATGRTVAADRSNSSLDSAHDHPGEPDDLGELGDLVENMGGQVLVLPAPQMPVRTGLAATYRY